MLQPGYETEMLDIAADMVMRVTRNMWTNGYGIVLEYNPDTCRADIQITCRVTIEGEEVDIKPLRDVPVQQLSGGGWFVDMPIYDETISKKTNRKYPPDEGIIVWLRHPLEGMLDEHETSMPLHGDVVDFDVNNAVFIPMKKWAISDGKRKSHHVWTEVNALGVTESAVLSVLNYTPIGQQVHSILGSVGDIFNNVKGLVGNLLSGDLLPAPLQGVFDQIKGPLEDVIKNGVTSVLETALQGTPLGGALAAFKGLKGAIEGFQEDGLKGLLAGAAKGALEGVIPGPLLNIVEGPLADVLDSGIAGAAENILSDTPAGDLFTSVDKLKDTAQQLADQGSQGIPNLSPSMQQFANDLQAVKDKITETRDLLNELPPELVEEIPEDVDPIKDLATYVNHNLRIYHEKYHQEIVLTNPETDGRIVFSVDGDSPKPWIEMIEDGPHSIGFAEPMAQKYNNHGHLASAGPGVDGAPAEEYIWKPTDDWSDNARIGNAKQHPKKMHPECDHGDSLPQQFFERIKGVAVDLVSEIDPSA